MARFRVGPVRFGGGRKASIGFHGFGVGATFGGGRRSSSGYGSGSSDGGYVETVEWDSLTDKEKANLPLKSFKSIDIGNSALSENDKALLVYRRKKREYQIRGYLIAAVLVVVTIFSAASPIILGSFSLFSIMASITFLFKKFKTTRLKPGVEPTDKQLSDWAFVNHDTPLPSLNIAFSVIQEKYGDDATQAVQNLTGEKPAPSRRLTFKDFLVANFYINLVLLISALCALGIASSDNSTNCVGESYGPYSGFIWGIEDCFGISEQISALKEMLVLICFSTLIAFTISMFLGCKPTYKKHLTPLVKLFVKKTQIEKLKTKNISATLKQRKDQAQQLQKP